MKAFGKEYVPPVEEEAAVRRLFNRAFIVACLGLLFSGTAWSSTYTGQVLSVRTALSPAASGHVRVSIQISGTTSCGNSSWFSFDLPDESATGKLWAATVLAALHSGRSVTIAGTGQCDPYAIETIYYVDAM